MLAGFFERLSNRRASLSANVRANVSANVGANVFRGWHWLNGRCLSLGFLFQLFGLEVRHHRVNQLVNPALHNLVELMDRQAYAVIGDAVLFEIVGADFFRTVAAADLRTALG